MLERVDIRRRSELFDGAKVSTAAIRDARIADRECRKQRAGRGAEADQIDAAVAGRGDHATSGFERPKRGIEIIGRGDVDSREHDGAKSECKDLCAGVGQALSEIPPALIDVQARNVRGNRRHPPSRVRRAGDDRCRPCALGGAEPRGDHRSEQAGRALDRQPLRRGFALGRARENHDRPRHGTRVYPRR